MWSFFYVDIHSLFLCRYPVTFQKLFPFFCMIYFSRHLFITPCSFHIHGSLIIDFSQCVLTMSGYVTPQILQNGLSSLTMCHHIPTHLPSSLAMCVITSLQIFPHPLQCASSHPFKSSLILYNPSHPYKSSLILYNSSHPYKSYRSHSAHPDEVCHINTAEGRS